MVQFEPISVPQPGGWLAEHKEPGQTFDQFVKSRPRRPDARRSTLYFVSFGDFEVDWSPKLADLEACAGAFFQIAVKSLPPQPLDEKRITTRERSDRRQYLIPERLRHERFTVAGCVARAVVEGSVSQLSSPLSLSYEPSAVGQALPDVSLNTTQGGHRAPHPILGSLEWNTRQESIRLRLT